MKRIFLPLLLLLSLSACSLYKGPATVPGMKSLAIASGRISDLRPGSRVLVISPFTRTRDACYICRGEDAANFAESFSELGLFATELRFDDDPEALLADLLHQSPAQIQERFGLNGPPDLLLEGVTMKRKVLFNISSDVTMNAAYLLTFHDLHSGGKTVIKADVHDSFELVAPTVVQALADGIAAGTP